MAQATDTIWIPTLPSMKGFGPALVKQGSKEAATGGKSLGGTMGKAMVVGVAAAAAGVAGVGAILYQTGKTFEEMSNTIRVGTGATGDALKDLEGSAKSVGKNVPASFEDIGTAIADVNTRTGLTGKPLEDMTSQFLELSRITGTDVATNIEKATRVFGDWGIEADDQSDTLDHLFKVSQSTGIGIDDLSTKVVDNGSVFRQLGFSFEESTALLGKFEKEGVNGSKVMSGMTQSLGRMAKAGEDPIETFQRVTDEIKNAEDPAEASGLALEMFGQRAGPDMVAAIREGRFEIGDLMGTLDDSSETIMGAGEDTMTFTEEWQKFKNNVLVWLEPMAARVFGALGDFMADVVEGVGLFGDAWEDNTGKVTASGLPGFMQDLGGKARTAFDYFQDNVMPVLRDMGSYITDTLVPNLQSFGTWLDNNKRTIGIVAGVITAIMLPALVRMGVTSLISAGQSVAAWTMQRVAAVQAGLAYVVQSIRIIGTWVAMAAAAVTSGLRIAAVWTFQIVRSAVVGAASFMISVARVVGGWVLMGVQSMLHAARMAAAWFIALGPLGWVTAGIIAIAALIIANWDKISEWTKKAWTAVKDWVVGAWRNIRDRTMEILGKIATWISDKFTAIRDTTARIWNGVRDKIASVWNSIRDKISSVWNDKIKPVFNAFSNFIKDTVVGRIEKGIDMIKTAWEKVANIFRKPINWVINTVWNGGIKKAFDAVSKAVGSDTRLAEVKEIGAFEKGGLAPKGWALVGEAGPELVNFANPGRVYTADQTRTALSGDVKEGESVHPMGGLLSWFRGGLANTAEKLLKPIVDGVSGTMSSYGNMGKLGGGLVDHGFKTVIDWIRGKDEEGDGAGAEFDGPMQNGRAYRPGRGPITSWYGQRGGRLHGGIDFAGPRGAPTFAAWDGVVHSIRNYSGSGLSVNLSHGGGKYSHYGHNDPGGIPVRQGQRVSAGQRIGNMGMTGRTTGPHVHFETWQGGMWDRRNPNHLFRDKGGLLPPGVSSVLNNTGGNEYVFNKQQFDNLNRMAKHSQPTEASLVGARVEMGSDGFATFVDGRVLVSMKSPRVAQAASESIQRHVVKRKQGA